MRVNATVTHSMTLSSGHTAEPTIRILARENKANASVGVNAVQAVRCELRAI